MTNQVTFGSDGGNFTPYIGNNNIGYSDGQPFVSIEKQWKPFPNAHFSLPSFNKEEKMWGITYGFFANTRELETESAKESQKEMYSLNNNWVCLPIVCYQQTYNSTNIYADFVQTLSDQDISNFVSKAHNRNVKIFLKPTLVSKDDIWRGSIGFLHSEGFNSFWNSWFSSYKNFILHYAELAQNLGVELFSIGHELLNTEFRQYDWEFLIKEVRRVYKGKITYGTFRNCEDSYGWFDLLDYIGISAYYPVGDSEGTLSSMTKDWEKIKWRLDAIARSRKKQFIFTEIGCPASEKGNLEPWRIPNYKRNNDVQLNYFKSCINIFQNDPCFGGMFIWEWPTKLDSSSRRYSIAANETKDFIKEKFSEVIK